MTVEIGVFPSTSGAGDHSPAALMQQVADAGLDFVGMGDHVSFHTGFGVDGLIQAAALLAAHPTLPVATGVYLLVLRHPVVVARQLATIASFAPGRLVFGVGIGGEDRHEVEVCGVDPRTRGRRMNECLEIVRRLLAGERVEYEGEFFTLQDALVLPAPVPSIPIVVGGRSAAAVRRAGSLGDGWLGIWVSADRFVAATAEAQRCAADAGRIDYPAAHALQAWCGFGSSASAGRDLLAPAMEMIYQTPFSAFERYCPAGTPNDVAEFLAPYVEAGCRSFSLIAVGTDHQRVLEQAAEVKRLLNA